MPRIKTIIIKEGMPSIDEARKKLISEIEIARGAGVRILKIIHGWGSSGVGGVLKTAIRKSLSHRKKEGFVEFVIYGEKFNVFNMDIRLVIKKYPELKTDKDFNLNNEGVTIAILLPNKKQ